MHYVRYTPRSNCSPGSGWGKNKNKPDSVLKETVCLWYRYWPLTSLLTFKIESKIYHDKNLNQFHESFFVLSSAAITRSRIIDPLTSWPQNQRWTRVHLEILRKSGVIRWTVFWPLNKSVFELSLFSIRGQNNKLFFPLYIFKSVNELIQLFIWKKKKKIASFIT